MTIFCFVPYFKLRWPVSISICLSDYNLQLSSQVADLSLQSRPVLSWSLFFPYVEKHSILLKMLSNITICTRVLSIRLIWFYVGFYLISYPQHCISIFSFVGTLLKCLIYFPEGKTHQPYRSILPWFLQSIWLDPKYPNDNLMLCCAGAVMLMTINTRTWLEVVLLPWMYPTASPRRSLWTCRIRFCCMRCRLFMLESLWTKFP